MRRRDDPVRFTLPSDAGIRLVRMQDTEAFIDIVNEHLFGLMVTRSLGTGTKAYLRRLRFTNPDAHLVLVLEAEPSSSEAPPVAGPRVIALPASATSEVRTRALRGAWFEGRVQNIRRAARKRPLPAVIRCAVLAILDERLIAKFPEPDEVTLHRTLAALAARCGTHRDTLRRASRGCGIPLKALMNGWCAALALRERFVEVDVPSGAAWSTIARRCGYASESGLRALMKRELATALPELRFGQLGELLERLESNVAGTGPP